MYRSSTTQNSRSQAILIGALVGLTLTVSIATPALLAAESEEAQELLQRGFHLIQSNKWSEAIECLERAEKLQPSNWDIETNLGFAFERQGNEEQAFGHYKSAYLIDSSKLTSVLGLSNSYASSKNYGPAISICQRYVADCGGVKEENFAVFRMLGFLYANEKQPKEVYINYQQALTLHPTEEEAWVCAIDDIDFAGGTVEMVAVIREFLKRFPSSSHVKDYSERLRQANFQIERLSTLKRALLQEKSDNKNTNIDDFIIFTDKRRNGISEAAVSMVKQGLISLPRLFIDQLRSAGYRVVIAEHLTDALPEIASDHPRGWAKVATWHNSNGTFDGKHKWIVIGEKFNDLVTGKEIADSQMDRTIAHEFGHAYDYFLGNSAPTYSDTEIYTNLSHSAEFSMAYEKDAQRIQDKAVRKKLDYFLQSDNAGKEELFAQLFPFFYCGTPQPNSPEELFSLNFPAVLATMKEALASDPEYAKLYGRNVKNYK